MKYMIMTFGDTSALEGKSPEWIKEMIEFMQRIDVELTESGELVFQQGLADPSQARTVKVQQGVPVATDGPFAESRESLVGFWVVDVENEARAVEIAARISRAADARVAGTARPDGPVRAGRRSRPAADVLPPRAAGASQLALTLRAVGGSQHSSMCLPGRQVSAFQPLLTRWSHSNIEPYGWDLSRATSGYSSAGP